MTVPRRRSRDRSWAAFDELLARPVSLRSRALLRMLVGAITVVHLWPIAVDALGGDTYHDRFHRPYIPLLADLPPSVYAAILLAGVVAAGAMSLGVATRTASWLAFGVVAYHLLLSTTHVHNNRAYLVTILFLLALTPSGGVWSIDAWRRSAPPEASAAAWPLWLLRFACATVYGASGLSKLLDPDWFGGTVTWMRVVAQEAMVRDSLLPDLVVDVLVDRSFHSVAAKLIVVTELFIAAGLWWRRTRPLAVAAAVGFHLMIEVSSNVQIFSWLGLAVLVVWADPSLPAFDAVRQRIPVGRRRVPRVSA